MNSLHKAWPEAVCLQCQWHILQVSKILQPNLFINGNLCVDGGGSGGIDIKFQPNPLKNEDFDRPSRFPNHHQAKIEIRFSPRDETKPYRKAGFLIFFPDNFMLLTTVRSLMIFQLLSIIAGHGANFTPQNQLSRFSFLFPFFRLCLKQRKILWFRRWQFGWVPSLIVIFLPALWTRHLLYCLCYSKLKITK